MAGVMSNGKHIAVAISAAGAILVWKPQEIARTLLNPNFVPLEGFFPRKIASCRMSVLDVRNVSVVNV
jgi:hypothetical protein